MSTNHNNCTIPQILPSLIWLFVDYSTEVLPAFGPSDVENDLYFAFFDQPSDFGIPSAQTTPGMLSQIEFEITIQDQFYSASSSDAQMLMNLLDRGTQIYPTDYVKLLIKNG